MRLSPSLLSLSAIFLLTACAAAPAPEAMKADDKPAAMEKKDDKKDDKKQGDEKKETDDKKEGDEKKDDKKEGDEKKAADEKKDAEVGAKLTGAVTVNLAKKRGEGKKHKGQGEGGASCQEVPDTRCQPPCAFGKYCVGYRRGGGLAFQCVGGNEAEACMSR